MSRVSHPDHYQTSAGLEAIDVIEAFFYDNFHLANAFKYIARAGKKGDYVEDLGKAAWYLQREIERHKCRSFPAIPEGAAMSDTKAIALASTLALGLPRSWVDGCVAWVDSRDEQCGKPRKEGFLCARHHRVAERHLEKKKQAAEKRKQQRQERLEKHGDKWRSQLARVEAELERRTGMHTTDRAAYGGVGVTSVAKHNAKQFSDSNVKRVGELIRQRDDLRQKLGIKERN